MRVSYIASLVFVVLSAACVARVAAAEPCRIEVVDSENGWPVPLVELRTTNDQRWVTDNNGLIALDAPELLGQETWFHVQGHGYEVSKDGFGLRGVRLTPAAGKTLQVKVERRLPAKRLGRLTGGGIFAESQKLGEELKWRESGIVGCDSVHNAMLGDRLFWLWGDTNVQRYPLGIFHSIGATTPVQPLKSFEPPVRLEYDYIADEQKRPRAIAPMKGEGPTWPTGIVSLPDREGQERLVGIYAKIKPPLEVYLWGRCVWNEELALFEPLDELWRQTDESKKPPPMPEGHATLWTDDAGQRWVLFGNPLPKLRCPATFEAWRDRSTWEVLEPQVSLRSASDGSEVKPHSGSIAWNAYRKRWVTVFMQWYGKPSVFGELWYAEAKSPFGPWGPAVKVVTHENYTFYNPRLHPEFTPDDSPVLLFEGTYTVQFADKPVATPRYDYNQILYRLDLDDAALAAAME
jgi:hypothetical protein